MPVPLPIHLRRVALAAVLVGLAACGGGSDDDDAASEMTSTPDAAVPETTAEPTAPFEVDVLTETFVDSSRPTEGSEPPDLPDRTIVTRIAHPTGGGPYPLIVMAHGFTGHPDEYAETTPMWAADGFVVAQPTFPLTNREAPGVQGNIDDVVNQPADVSFVIDEVLDANDDPSSPLHGLVDPEAIGVAGHSLGGATTWAVSFNSAMRDERIDSTVIFAGLTLPMAEGDLELDSGLPLLVLHGDADDVPIELDHGPYEQATSPKWFVTLLGATHVPAFTDAESPYDDLVTRTVLDFWHGTLDDDAGALEQVTDDATDPALSTVEHE
ncbi:MAG TPA: dienelactone hydrolase family protein [Iamia sp.]|jgi:dienelactone hydrolase|nr:dienelactone hydrolase family protein [Iamia sp.]